MKSEITTGDTTKNALKTGVYSRDTLLPWEEEAEYEEHRTEIFDDYLPVGKIQSGIVGNMADNRWLRERLRRSTAIATRQHSYGRELEQSGVRSWQEAQKFLSEREDEHRKLFRNIDESMRQITIMLEDLSEESEDAEIVKYAKRIRKGFQDNGTLLDEIARALNDEREFFQEYSPKKLQKRILLENALDAQFDKMRARLIIEIEARIVREKMLGKTILRENDPRE